MVHVLYVGQRQCSLEMTCFLGLSQQLENLKISGNARSVAILGQRGMNMPRRRRLEDTQTKLIAPDVEAMEEFKQELGESLISQEFICPFCAYKATLVNFRMKKSEKSESFSKRKFQCPDCGQNMLRETLLNDMTVSEWARWLYTSIIDSHGKGYERISFPKLFERLKQYGWAGEFWEAWRAAKEGRGTSSVEDYISYLKSAAEEERKNCQTFQENKAGKSSIICVQCEKYKICWGVKV